MTLRGELDSFPLETVVQLIHSTNKTGQLEIRDGDATGGTLGFDRSKMHVFDKETGEAIA